VIDSDGGRYRIRTCDFHRVKLYNDLQDCGNCLRTRKSHKTSHFVG
jgi:hypothetical protein